MSRKCPVAGPKTPCGSTGLALLKKHLVHHRPQPGQVVPQDMPVDPQGGGYIGVAHPRLNVLCVRSAFAKGVDRRMSEIMEPHQWKVMLLQNEPEMMGHKVGVDRLTVGLDAHHAAVNVGPAE